MSDRAAKSRVAVTANPDSARGLDWTRGDTPGRESVVCRHYKPLGGSQILHDGRDHGRAHQLLAATATDYRQCNFGIHRSLTM